MLITTELEKLANDFNYTVVETGNVTFRFNKWELTNEAKAALRPDDPKGHFHARAAHRGAGLHLRHRAYL